MRGIRGGALALDIDRYVEAVRKFNELVGELAAKLQQISDARDEALKASADLKRELDSTDQRMMDISSAVRQQITLEFTTKKSVVRSEDVADYPVGSRRAV
jgi:methyl-accepting chemotaxis protein